MRVMQSKFTKTNPQQIFKPGARSARRSLIRLCSDPKNSTAPGPRPPVLKFLDPPLSASGTIY